MLELIGVAGNRIFQKVGDKYKPNYEIILLLSEPNYKLNNQLELSRDRDIKEIRFFAKDIKALSEKLLGLETSLAENDND